jgi:iron complex outermembrane receptor protein
MKARYQGWSGLLISLAAVAASSAWSAPPARGGDSSTPLYFEIEEGPAQTQLTEFSKQSELQMVFDYDSVRGVTTQAVQGNYKPLEALRLMVKGTDITFELLERRTVTINRPRADSKSAEKTRPVSTALASRPKRDRRTPDATIEQQVTVRADAATTSLPATGSPHLSLARPDLDAGGFVTVPSVIRTLPQVFGGGPTEDTDQVGFEAQTNTARGSGINLRGLGASSTLVLMNGRRLAGGGSEGLFVDVSNLPLAAVERIDLLPDNSSTFYGSDAVGGVVNFVMRNDFEGAQTEGFFSGATKGHVGENYVSQIVGGTLGTFRGVMTFDFHSRDNLPAADRSQATSDLTPWGGSNFNVIQANPGNIVIGSSTWALPKLPDGRQPTVADLTPGTPNLQDRWESADLLPSQQRWTMLSTVEKKLNDDFTVFFDALYGQRDMRSKGSGSGVTVPVPTSNPFLLNPSGLPLPVSVAYSFLDELGPLQTDVQVRTQDYAAVMTWDRGDNWSVRGTISHASESLDLSLSNTIDRDALEAALGDSNPATALNLFGGPNNPATIASLRSEAQFDSRSVVRSAGVIATGDIANLNGGPVTLSFGAEQREQELVQRTREIRSQPTAFDEHLARKVRSAFAELTIPFAGAANARPGLQELEISLAERYEDFSDFGGVATSRLGLSWKPSRTLTLRGSYSESFRPPGLADLSETTNAYGYVPLPHPVTGTPTMTLIWVGKNRDLQEERAHSWTAGFDLLPWNSPGAALAATYFDIRFRGRLNRPSLTLDLLSNPELSPLVQWNPSEAYRADVCARSHVDGGPLPCLGVPVEAIVDLRSRNDAVTATRGIDLLAKYERDTDLGRLSLAVNGTYIFEFSEAKAAWQPLVDNVSTPSNPINLRFRTTARWERGPIDVAGFVNYLNSYRDTVSEPSRHVSSWTTIDLQTAYQFGRDAPGPLSDLRVSLGIVNLLDARPPFVNNPLGIGYDQENGDLLGRVISMSVRKKW